MNTERPKMSELASAAMDAIEAGESVTMDDLFECFTEGVKQAAIHPMAKEICFGMAEALRVVHRSVNSKIPPEGQVVYFAELLSNVKEVASGVNIYANNGTSTYVPPSA